MARLTKKVTIPGTRSEALGQRDNGKTFVIAEMDADTAEAWATRALLALVNSGAMLPDGAMESGMAGFAAAGLNALQRLSYATAAPLLADMFTCIQYQHAPNQPLQDIIPGPNSQIEEVGTRVQLRLAWLELHTGFSMADALPIMTTSPQAPSA